jgi:predicted dehydrogenase
MDNPEIDIVLNLTNPAAHAEISLAALNAGKNVYSEKPLAVELEDGKKIVNLAKEKGLLVGCAPDTFLGGRLQTCRKLIDEGWIGEPIGATAFMACHGHEIWHPGPEFFYKTGAGPMFDMGPYYMTALVTLLGSVNRVCGSTRISFSERRITSEPLNGQMIDVDVPTHITGTLEFNTGAIATILTSFDVWDSHLPRLEVYGSEGTLSIADGDPLAGPNLFEGKILLRTKDTADWNELPTMIPRREPTPWDEIPMAFGYNQNSRGVGLADMSYAIINKRPHRVNADTAYHVLEIMHGIHIAANQGQYYQMKSSCERPEPFKMGMPEYVITD